MKLTQHILAASLLISTGAFTLNAQNSLSATQASSYNSHGQIHVNNGASTNAIISIVPQAASVFSQIQALELKQNNGIAINKQLLIDAYKEYHSILQHQLIVNTHLTENEKFEIAKELARIEKLM